MTEHRLDEHTIELRQEPQPVVIASQWEPRAETPYTYVTNCTSDCRREVRPFDRGYYARTFSRGPKFSRNPKHA